MSESVVHPGDIQASSAPVGRRSVRLIELDGQALIYDDEIRHWIVLNHTASALWQCLDGSATVAEIADDLSAVFGAQPEKAQEQVLHMVRLLGHQGMLEGIVPFRPTETEPGVQGVDAPPQTEELFPQVPPTT